MTTTTAPGFDWVAARAAREAELLASFDPTVPGVPAEDDGKVLHIDAERGLTYRWYNISRRPQDFSCRDRGYLISQVVVTYRTPAGEDIEVAHLNLSHTTKELLAAEFPTVFHWAEENTGVTFGLRRAAREGRVVSDAEIWASAYTDLYRAIGAPASMSGTSHWGAFSPSQAPTDPKTLKAEIKVAERHYRKLMQGFTRWLANPFVDYSHVDSDWDANGVEGHPGNLRGTGIGRHMYLLAAQHLATYGKVLRASGLQSDEAQRLWDRLIADPAIPTRLTRPKFWKPTANPNKTYPCLDYTRKDKP